MASLPTLPPPNNPPHPTSSLKSLKIKKYRQQFIKRAVFRLRPASTYESTAEYESYGAEVQASWVMPQYFDFSDII